MNNQKNFIEIKNKIYRFEMINKIYNRISFLEFEEILKYANHFYKDIIKKDVEIKKKFIRIFIYYANYYKKKKSIVNIIKNIINKMSNNKILLIISKNKSINKYIKRI